MKCRSHERQASVSKDKPDGFRSKLYWVRRLHAGITFPKSPLQCAGLNRHEVEDARALRERSSDPLGLESWAATAKNTAKRRQRIGGVAIQFRHVQKKNEKG